MTPPEEIPEEPLLNVEGLAIGHAGKRLVGGLSHALRPGSVTTLIGPNGVGKTTLFRTVLGLLPPMAGTVRAEGTSLADLSRPEIARRIALVPQSTTGPFSYSALDLVLMGRTARMGPFAVPSKSDVAVAEAALAQLSIAHLAGRDTSRLSGGERQLVLIARALAQQTPVVLLDEPTASLDLGNTLLVLDTIEKLVADGKAVLVSTHDPGHALRFGGQAIALSRSGEAWAGPVEDIVTGPLLTRLYEVPLRVERLASGRALISPSEPDRADR